VTGPRHASQKKKEMKFAQGLLYLGQKTV